VPLSSGEILQDHGFCHCLFSRRKTAREAGRETVAHDGEPIRLAYDVAPDGSVIFSNGSAVYRIGPNGRQERLSMDRLIEQVVVLKTVPPSA
jgi:hypothetical protein